MSNISYEATFNLSFFLNYSDICLQKELISKIPTARKKNIDLVPLSTANESFYFAYSSSPQEKNELKLFVYSLISASSLLLNLLVLWYKQFFGKIRDSV